MNPLVERLGWMLLHSVWEDILIWGMLQLALIALGRKSSQARYLAACLALVAMAGLPWLTFDAADLSARLKESHSVSGQIASSPSSPAGPVFTGERSRETTAWLPGDVASFRERPDNVSLALPLLVALWGVGLLFSCTRLWMKWRRVQALLRQPFQLLDPAWRQRFERLVQLSGVDRIVRLGETAAVSVPVVAGWLKPVILLPLGVVMSLPTEQVEAILLHELAHISRHDYLVNLLQSIVETIFFYHPAVWAVSRRIRRERELACDDLTVRWCQDPRTYAQALAGFEEYRRHQLLLAATGEGELVARIRRILTGPQPEGRGVPLFAVAGFCGIGLYLASMLLVPVLAQQVMTAKERVARIEALQPPIPAGFVLPTEKFELTGTIRTEDGQPLPDGPIQAAASSHRPNWSTTASFGIEREKGTFSLDLYTGRIGLGIWARGYAPLQMAGIPSPNAPLHLVLKRGFPARVHVTGLKGEPLEGVQVTAMSRDSDNQIILSMPDVRTDAAGQATIGNVEAQTELHLTADKPGWQSVEQVVSQWSDHEPASWVLHPAQPTSGIAIDSSTRQPIPGAAIVLAARRTSDASTSMAYAPDSGPPMGHADANGRFELPSLNNDISYRIYILSPGYQPMGFSIQAGDKDKVFELLPGLHLRGKIVDPEGSLKKAKKPELRCEYTIQMTQMSSYGQTKSLPLSHPEPEIPFAFDDLTSGIITLSIGQQHFTLDLEKNVDDFVIDLGAKGLPSSDGKPALRKLQINFRTAGAPVFPSGNMEIDYQEVVHSFDPAIVPIHNGVAVGELTVPNHIDLRADGLIGYWFEPLSLNVSAGAETFTQTIDVLPAGVIHGNVTASPDLKARPFLIYPIVLQKPPGMQNINLTSGGTTGRPLDKDYVTWPLPFGGTYAVVFQSSPSYFVSSPAVVDAGHPIVARDMDFVANDTIQGKFVDEKNAPLGFQEVNMTYHPTEDHGFSSDVAMTRRDGTFTISRINFNVPGNYELQLFGDAWDNSSLRIDRHTPQPVTLVMRHRAH